MNMRTWLCWLASERFRSRLRELLDDVRFRCLTLAGMGGTGAIVAGAPGALFSTPYVRAPLPTGVAVDCCWSAEDLVDNSSQVVRRPVEDGEKGPPSGSRSAEAGVTGPPEV